MMINKSIYCGSSLHEASNIESILIKNNIPCKFRKIDHTNDSILIGKGSTRSFGGNFLTEPIIYEISVKKPDYEKARYIISQYNENS